MRLLLLFWCFSSVIIVFGDSTECQDIVRKIEILITELKEKCIDGGRNKKDPELSIRTDGDQNVDDIVAMVSSIFGTEPSNLTIETTTGGIDDTTVTTQATTEDIRSTTGQEYMTTILDLLTTFKNQITTTEVDTTTRDITTITTDFPVTTEGILMTTDGNSSVESTTNDGTTQEVFNATTTVINPTSQETTTIKEDLTTINLTMEENLTTKDATIEENDILGVRQDLSGDDVVPVTEVDDNLKKPSKILDVLTGLVSDIEDNSPKDTSSQTECPNLDEFYIPVLRICAKTRRKYNQKLKFSFVKK